MSQQHLAAAVTGEAELLHHNSFLSVGHRRTVKVGPLAVGITLELLEAALVVEPLIGQQLPAIHAAHRDDHLDMAVGLRSRPRQVCVFLSGSLRQNMSSALFGRGTLLQTGHRQRQDQLDKQFAELRSFAVAATAEIRALQEFRASAEKEIAALRAQISGQPAQPSPSESSQTAAAPSAE